jgi:hypothetical protein
MKWKIATASVVAAAIMSAPVASAAPANDNSNVGGARNAIGQTISQIAKNGGGAAAILGQLVQFKPANKGLAKALQNLLNPKPPTDTTVAPPA